MGRTTNLIVYGEPRIGKSIYTIKVTKELYADNPNPDEWRNHYVFRPEQFISYMNERLTTGQKSLITTWDDAGLWLFALDWNDPRVKAVMKLLQVSGVATSALVFTTPAVSMIIKKVLNIEGILVGKVVKQSGKSDTQRTVKIYKNSIAAWGKRYVKQIMEDSFNVMLEPHDYNYYFPQRMTYLHEALEMLSNAYGIALKDIDDVKSLAEQRAAEAHERVENDHDNRA
jgi:hypothetical protein